MRRHLLPFLLFLASPLLPAYYDFYAYEPDITSKGVPEAILVALAETFRNGSYPGPPLPQPWSQ